MAYHVKDMAVVEEGYIFAGSGQLTLVAPDGSIRRQVELPMLTRASKNCTRFVAVNKKGVPYVIDARKGLIRVTPQGEITELQLGGPDGQSITPAEIALSLIHI